MGVQLNPKLLLVLREAKALKLREKARSRSRREASKIETKLSGRKTQMNEKEKCGGSLKKKKKKKKKREENVDAHQDAAGRRRPSPAPLRLRYAREMDGDQRWPQVQGAETRLEFFLALMGRGKDTRRNDSVSL
jgi:hypothetical protein